MKAVFDNLIHLEHANIVKFHKYWADTKDNRARVSTGIIKSSVTCMNRITHHKIKDNILMPLV